MSTLIQYNQILSLIKSGHLDTNRLLWPPDVDSPLIGKDSDAGKN